MTYKTARKAKREYIMERRKEGLRQLNNFQNILSNMEKLKTLIDNYNGVISADKLDSIANLINVENKLSLTEDQVKMVTKHYV